MTSTWKSGADSLVGDLRNVFGSRLLAVVAYGPRIEGSDHDPLTCLALVESLTAEDLQACAQNVRRWARAQIATPLIVPAHEFMRSLDTFPLEYGEIIRAHELVFGDNPFSSAAIASEDLRRACERVKFVAGKFEDDSLRRSWLDNVQVNREIMSSYRRLRLDNQ